MLHDQGTPGKRMQQRCKQEYITHDIHRTEVIFSIEVASQRRVSRRHTIVRADGQFHLRGASRLSSN